ncbi:MAG: methyltransferase, partial [Oscillospiraceae bacterium]|nr:methyltransferase [Oscillospiraceae bacterium]
MIYTLEELKKEGCKILNGKIQDAEFDALQILLFTFQLDNTSFLLQKNLPADKHKSNEYFSLILKRAAGEPLQYIIKDQIFLDMKYKVGEGVLIPRPETEELADLCINKIKDKGYEIIFDLCAGSGCIGISIAESCPKTKVYLFEKYDGAIRYLLENIPDHLKSRVSFVKADIFDFDFSILDQPDLIVSN